MAPRTWRLQEYTLLTALCDTDEGRQLLSKATASEDTNDPWWLHCCNYWTRKYKDAFSECFPAETEEELLQRKARQPRAKTLKLFPAETVAEKEHRLQRVRERIGSFLKGLSPNRTPRTQTARGKKKDAQKDKSSTSRSSVRSPPVSVSAPSASIAAPSATTLATSTSSVSPVRPARAGDGALALTLRPSADVQDRDQFARAAKQLEHAVHDLAVCPSVSREDKLHIMISLFKDVAHSVARATGWVGWFPIGGVDEHDRFVFEHPSTAFTSDGSSFEDYLSKQLGWSVDRLLCTFDNFIRDIYDPPQLSSPASNASLLQAQLPNDTFGHPRDVLSPTAEINAGTVSVVTPSRATPLQHSATQSSTPRTLAPDASPVAVDVQPMVESQSPPHLVAAHLLQQLPPNASDEPGTHFQTKVKDLTEQLPVVPEASALPEGPPVVFGQPPPRVLTTPNPPSKQPARQRGVHRRSRRGGKSSQRTKSAKTAPKTLAAGSVNSATTDAVTRTQCKTKARVKPVLEPMAQNENEPMAADLADGNIVLGKRKRVATARKNQESPDFSAAKKVRRDIPENSDLPTVQEPERPGPAAKGRKRNRS